MSPILFFFLIVSVVAGLASCGCVLGFKLANKTEMYLQDMEDEQDLFDGIQRGRKQ